MTPFDGSILLWVWEVLHSPREHIALLLALPIKNCQLDSGDLSEFADFDNGVRDGRQGNRTQQETLES